MKREASRVDVVILGGGPAGAATALKLKQRTPSLSVLLVERSGYDKPRIGESLPPGTQTLLRELGAWDSFREIGSQPAFGIKSAWGQPAFATNDFLFHTGGQGWVVDRTRFDRMLADLARERGVDLRAESRAREIAKADSGRWEIDLATKSGEVTPIDAGFIVDATGRTASFAKKQGARPVIFDNLVAVHGLLSSPGTEPTLIEAFADGWWYSTSLPNGRRLVACFTDRDLAKSLNLSDPAAWHGQLMATRGTRTTVGCDELPARLGTSSAHSQRLDSVFGENWLAVGDAASTYDPLSSQGIFKGMRSGIFAAYAIADYLESGSIESLEKYQFFIEQEFESYLTTRAEFYATERRWPDREFWKRRLETIELDPHTLLVHGSATQGSRCYQLTPSQTHQIVRLCATPARAHEVAEALQQRHPTLSASRIILGIQHLMNSGILHQQANGFEEPEPQIAQNPRVVLASARPQ